MDLTELYGDLVKDHSKSPRNFGKLDPADAHADGHNPLCGDKLSVSLRMNGETVEDVRFEGDGCQISMASASFMTEAVKGKSKAAITALFEKVHSFLTRSDAVPGPELGKIVALSGVHKFPMRVKCATLCWHTLNAALDKGAGTVSTE